VPEPTPAAKPEPVAASSAPKAEPKPETKSEPKKVKGTATVHLRTSGVAGIDIKLGSKVYSVRPHADVFVPAGKHALRWRVSASSEWSAASSFTFVPGSEWLIKAGPGGVTGKNMGN
jgi:hypothetical protein